MEELDGVGVEGEALELLDEALRKDVFEVEDVQGDVDHRADEDQASKEGNDAHHSPILSLNTDLASEGYSSKSVLSCPPPLHRQCDSWWQQSHKVTSRGETGSALPRSSAPESSTAPEKGANVDG